MASPPSPPGGQSPPDLSAQIEATKQLAAAMAALLQQIGKTNQGLRDQSDVSSDLSDLLDDISDQREKEEKQAKERQEQLEKEIKNIKSISDFTGLLSKKMKEAAEGSKKMAVGMAAVSGAAKGFKAGISLMNGVLGAMGSILTTVIGTVFDLGIAILTGPIKMFNALFAKAKAGMSGMSELAQALEKVRENFGDIYSGLGATVASMGTQLSHGLIAPGLSAARVFGSVAEATNYANEMASQAPAAFQKLSAQFQDSALEALAMAKGLGISKEEFAGLMNVAVSSGRDIVDIETEMTKFAKGMASEFKLNSKMISRDMGRAMKDVKHFANLTVKELAKAATYAQGLGLELKDITGVLDAFNTFESAAENVSKLSQAFGVNLDTMKLLEAESPDEQIAHVKQAFESAGKSADQMNRRELQLLAQTLNMDEAMVRQALSTKNAGISMDKVKASSAGLEGQTMSTAEAMQALSKDIERVIKSGEPPKGDNFIEVFLEGVMEGMERTSAFRQLLLNMMKSIHAVRQAGRELGAQLMEVVPGLKELIKGLAELVAPDKIGGMFRAFSKSFIDFFQTLKSGGVASVKELVENLKKNFLDYLTKAGPGGQSFLNGLSDMWEAAKKIIISALDYLGEILESGINFLTDVLTGNFNAQASSIAGGIMGELAPILDAFGRLFDRLKEPVLKLLETAFNLIVEKVGGFLKDNWMIILGGYLSFAFIGAFANAFAAATGTAIMETIILPFLRTLAAKILAAAAAAKATDAGTSAIGSAGDSAGKQASKPFELGAATFARMAVFMLAALLAVGLIIAAVRQFDVKTEEVMLAVGIAFAAGILMVSAGAAVMMVGSVGPGATAASGPAMAALVPLGITVLAMLGVAALIMLAAANADNIKLESIGKVSLILLATSALLLVAAGIVYVASILGAAVTGSGGTALIALAVGLATMGFVVGVMIATAGVIMGMAHMIKDPDKVDSMVRLLEAVGNLYIKTIPVIGAVVAALATLMIPGSGIGFKKINDVVGDIIKTTEGVIDKLKGISAAEAAQLQSTIGPFISIMESVVNLIVSIGDVLESAGGGGISGIISSMTGKSPFAGAAELIGVLVGNKDTGIIGVINIIKETIPSLQKVSPAVITGFGTIISAVTSAVGSIASALDAMKSKGEFKYLYGLIDIKAEHGFDAAGNINAIKDFIAAMLPAAGDLISQIKSALGAFSAEEAAAIGPLAEGFGSILAAIATLLGTLTKNLDEFKKKSEENVGAQVSVTKGAQAGVKIIKEKFDPAAFAEFVKTVEERIQPILGHVRDFITGTIAGLSQVLSTIDPSKLEVLKPVADLLIATIEMMSELRKVGNVQIDMGKAASWGTTHVENRLSLAIPSIGESLSAMSTYMPTFFKALGEAFDAFKPASDAKSKIGLIKDSMGAISKIVKVLTETFPDMPVAKEGEKPAGEGTLSKGAQLTQKLLEMVSFVEELTQPVEESADSSPLALLSQKLSKLPTPPSQAAIQKLKSFSEGLKSISEVASALNAVSNIDLGGTISAGGETGPPTAEAARSSVISEQIAKAKLLIDTLGDPSVGFPMLETAIAEANKNVKGGAAAGLASLTSKLSGFDDVKQLPEVVSAVAAALPQELVDTSLGELDRALADFSKRLDAIVGTRPVEIQAKLKQTLGQLGVKGAKYIVDAKPIALTVNLNVTMSAGDVAAGIASAPTIIKSRIEQLATRSGVQGYDISQTIPTAST